MLIVALDTSKKEPLYEQIYNSIKEEIITGPATIRCFVDNEVREFDIEVTQVDMMSQEINKGLVIKVTDEELLEKTGGIIQGLSLIHI